MNAMQHNTALKAGRGQRAAVLMLLLAAFFWGSGNVANKTILQDLDPFAAVTARNLVAIIVLLPFAFRDLIRVPSLAAWTKSAIVPSVFFAVATTLQQWGYQLTSVTNASFLVNTGCILTPIVGYFLLRERVTTCVVIAAVITTIGAYLMSGAGHSLATMNLGDVACLLSAAFYAGWMVTLSLHATRHGCPMATTCLQSVLTTILASTILVFFAPPQPGVLEHALPEIFYLGVFSTAIAFGLAAAAQAHVSASTAAVVLAAESLVGAGGGILLLGERLGPQQSFGAALMLFAIFIAALLPSLPAEFRMPLSEKREV